MKISTRLVLTGSVFLVAWCICNFMGCNNAPPKPPVPAPTPAVNPAPITWDKMSEAEQKLAGEPYRLATTAPKFFGELDANCKGVLSLKDGRKFKLTWKNVRGAIQGGEAYGDEKFRAFVIEDGHEASRSNTVLLYFPLLGDQQERHECFVTPGDEGFEFQEIEVKSETAPAETDAK